MAKHTLIGIIIIMGVFKKKKEDLISLAGARAVAKHTLTLNLNLNLNFGAQTFPLFEISGP